MSQMLKGLMNVGLIGVLLFVTLNAALAEVEVKYPSITLQPPIEKEYDRRILESDVVGRDAEIPNVVNRDPNPDSGPRVWVNEFEIGSLPEYPETGVTRESVGVLVERLRRQAIGLNNHVAYGYSREHLVEIAEVLADIEKRGVFAEVTQSDAEQLVDLVADQKTRRGMTHGQLEEVAAAVTEFYRINGFFLARAFIPAQDVEDGIVRLEVLEGTLGGVVVDGNESYSDKRILVPFKKIQGGIVSKRVVEDALYLANDYPGLDIYGYFTAGDKVGETQLNLSVRNESRWSTALRLDNHGSEFTGEQRYFGVLELLNPTGRGDRLQIGALTTLKPSNSEYGSVEYHAPLFGARTFFALKGNVNTFTIGGESFEKLNFTGESASQEVDLRYVFRRGREQSYAVELMFTEDKSRLEKDEVLERKERSSSQGLKFEFDSLFEKKKILAQGYISADSGKIEDGALSGQDEKYDKANLDFSSLFFVKVPFTNITNRLVLHTTAQASSTRLPAVEQFSLGGANAVRAYQSADFSADEAYYGSLEWYLNIPSFLNFSVTPRKQLSDVIQISLFQERSYGKQRALDTNANLEDAWGRLNGRGVAVRYSWGDLLSGSISISEPVSHRFSDETFVFEPDESRVYMDLTFFLD